MMPPMNTRHNPAAPPTTGGNKRTAVVQGNLEVGRGAVHKHGMHPLRRYAKVLDRLAHHRRFAEFDLELIGLSARRPIVAQDTVKLDCDLHPEVGRMPW
jgi:hypothetical protein